MVLDSLMMVLDSLIMVLDRLMMVLDSLVVGLDCLVDLVVVEDPMVLIPLILHPHALTEMEMEMVKSQIMEETQTTECIWTEMPLLTEQEAR